MEERWYTPVFLFCLIPGVVLDWYNYRIRVWDRRSWNSLFKQHTFSGTDTVRQNRQVWSFLELFSLSSYQIVSSTSYLLFLLVPIHCGTFTSLFMRSFSLKRQLRRISGFVSFGHFIYTWIVLLSKTNNIYLRKTKFSLPSDSHLPFIPSLLVLL